MTLEDRLLVSTIELEHQAFMNKRYSFLMMKGNKSVFVKDSFVTRAKIEERILTGLCTREEFTVKKCKDGTIILADGKVTHVYTPME